MDIIEFHERIWDLLRSISNGIDSTLRSIVDGFGITMVQMRLLVELKSCQECTIGELSAAIASAPGNTSAMCKALEKKGLLTRTRAAEDERIVLVSLNEHGRNLLGRVENELSARCNPILGEYSDADYQEIIQGMTKLKEIVSSLHSGF